MRMLKNLRDELDLIEAEDDWAYRFLSDLIERVEETPAYRLSDKQFLKVKQLHGRWCA